jgi:hypothetical protein
MCYSRERNGGDCWARRERVELRHIWIETAGAIHFLTDGLLHARTDGSFFLFIPPSPLLFVCSS